MPAPFSPAAVAIFMLLTFAASAHAAGLGKAKVLSSTGELLKVRVELILGPGDRPGRIKAAVASPAIPEHDEENQLWVTVDPAPYGRAVLTVRSVAPIHDSRLALLVAVSSPAGRAYRSFDLELQAPKQKGGSGSAGTDASPPAVSTSAASGTREVSPGSTAPASVASVAKAPSPGESAEMGTADGSKSPGAGEVLGDFEDRAVFGRLMALVALGIAVVAALGAIGIYFYRRG
jgi:Tfp pilus assembly protein FimV